jgi:hypothetical protein
MPRPDKQAVPDDKSNFHPHHCPPGRQSDTDEVMMPSCGYSPGEERGLLDKSLINQPLLLWTEFCWIMLDSGSIQSIRWTEC